MRPTIEWVLKHRRRFLTWLEEQSCEKFLSTGVCDKHIQPIHMSFVGEVVR